MPRTTPFPDDYVLDPADFQVPVAPDPPSTPIFYVSVQPGSILHVMLAATTPEGSLEWVASGRYRAGQDPPISWGDADLFPGPHRQVLTPGRTRHTGEVFVQFQAEVEVFMGTWIHSNGNLHGTPRGRFLTGETNDIDGRHIFVRTTG